MFSTIVIGLDGSETAQTACDTGVELAGALGAHVHLVTAYSDASSSDDEVTPERQAAEELLASAAAACGPIEGGVTNHAQRGSPAATIIKVAEETDADLIVVGNRGMTGVRRVLGSVASAVTTQAPCTVLVVKTT